jgi:hypothetical protein
MAAARTNEPDVSIHPDGSYALNSVWAGFEPSDPGHAV